jgi:hypothetical protein
MKCSFLFFFFWIISNTLYTQNWVLDSVIKVYKKPYFHYKLTKKYYTNTELSSESAMDFYYYNETKNKILYYRLTDTLGFDYISNKSYFGFNNIPGNSYYDSKKNKLNEIDGELLPEYVFSPIKFKSYFQNNKRYKSSIIENENYYLLKLIEANNFNNRITQFENYTQEFYIDKKTFLVNKFKSSVDIKSGDYIIKDSAIYNFKYNDVKYSNLYIKKKVDSFKPFNKKIKDQMDTIDVNKRVGEILPEFNLIDTSGLKIDAKFVNSKYTVIDFWYKNCPPCHVNLKILSELTDKFIKSELEIIAINDIDDINNNVKSFVREQNKNIKFLFKKKSDSLNFEIEGYPTTILINSKTREILYYRVGTSEFIQDEIMRIIK